MKPGVEGAAKLARDSILNVANISGAMIADDDWTVVLIV